MMKAINHKTKCIYYAIICFFNLGILNAQAKYPIPLKIEEFRILSLSNDVKLNDTIKFIHSSNTYFRFVLFDPRGKSYFEIYRNKKLYSKGYYENSVDTLKDYTYSVPIDNQPSKIQVFEYFAPVKNGDWIELIDGKYRKKRYLMGVPVTDKNK